MQNDISENDLYTSLEEAKEEIWRRWNNPDLRRMVKDFVGDVPDIFKDQPKAFLSRYIATPNMEFFHFLKKVDGVNLKPIYGEYLEDFFFRMNVEKLALGKLPFYGNGNGKVDEIKVIDVNRNHGKLYREIKTSWGEHFIDFHHRLFLSFAPNIEAFDFSLWYKSKGRKAKEYYPFFLAIFINSGILFENFVTCGNEAKFTYDVVIPAFEMVKSLFGVKPLIVPLEPFEKVADQYWRCYPPELEAEVLKCLSECKAKDSSGHHHEGRYDGKDNGRYEFRK